MAGGELVGLAGGFGDAIAGRAFQGKRYRCPKAYAVAGGDVDGMHVGSGADD